jgi:hypothetical protein
MGMRSYPFQLLAVKRDNKPTIVVWQAIVGSLLPSEIISPQFNNFSVVEDFLGL